MPFDPAKLRDLDLLQPFDATCLIEETAVDRRPMPGWATPRRRPRRVHKKLEARGFTAHHGMPVRPAVQREHYRHTSPGLASELQRPYAPIAVTFKPVRWDGERLSTVNLPPDVIERGWFDEIAPRARERILSNAELARELPTTFNEMLVTFTGKSFGQTFRVIHRDLSALVPVFSPPHAVDGAPTLREVFGNYMHRLRRALEGAYYGTVTHKVIAKQSSYRPMGRVFR